MQRGGGAEIRDEWMDDERRRKGINRNLKYAE